MELYEDIRRKLLDELGPLEHRVGAIGHDQHAPGVRDWRERASNTARDLVLDGLSQHERNEIAAIHVAIERIDCGSYGTCTDCGSGIPIDRLRVVPFATTCVDCAD